MNDQQIALESIKAEIAKLSEEDQIAVNDTYEALKSIILTSGPTGYLALALIGATIAMEASNEGE